LTAALASERFKSEALGHGIKAFDNMVENYRGVLEEYEAKHHSILRKFNAFVKVAGKRLVVPDSIAEHLH